MKKSFLKFGLFLALGLTTAMCYSCKENEKPDIENPDGNGNIDDTFTIIATNVNNSSSKITTVKAIVDYSDYDNYHLIAQAPYKDNGFILKLPALPTNRLYPIFEEDDFENRNSHLIISDRSAKSFEGMDIEAYDKDEENIGGFYYSTNKDIDEGECVYWIYVDKNVTVKGEEYSEGYIDKWDMDLKEGWNVIYEIKSHNNSTGSDVYTSTMTTQKPSGVNYQWYFYNYRDNNYAISLKSAKSLSEKKSVFSKTKRR
jgi:hypothetical protein